MPATTLTTIPLLSQSPLQVRSKYSLSTFHWNHFIVCFPTCGGLSHYLQLTSNPLANVAHKSHHRLGPIRYVGLVQIFEFWIFNSNVVFLWFVFGSCNSSVCRTPNVFYTLHNPINGNVDNQNQLHCCHGWIWNLHWFHEQPWSLQLWAGPQVALRRLPPSQIPHVYAFVSLQFYPASHKLLSLCA